MGRKYDRNHPRTKANVKFRLRYGITIEQYEQMVSVQDNKCALCGQDGSLSPKGKLCVDHCHATRKVRGLLCNGCNAGLGYFRDDPNLLDKAIEYLKHNS